MTVTATQFNNNGGNSNQFLRVLVVTGADVSSTTSPVGKNGGGNLRTTNLSGTAAQYTSTQDGSRGWLQYADWSQQAIPTVPDGESVDSSVTIAGQNTYAVIKNATTTTTSGTTV